MINTVPQQSLIISGHLRLYLLVWDVVAGKVGKGGGNIHEFIITQEPDLSLIKGNMLVPGIALVSEKHHDILPSL